MSLSVANTKKLRAQRMRAEWILSLQSGVVSVPDLIRAATSESHRPLRKVTLQQLLEADGFSRDRAKRVLGLLRTHLGIAPDRRLNIAWLIDARADGRRLHVWADALQERVAPWTGFPITPCPHPAAVDAPSRHEEGASDD